MEELRKLCRFADRWIDLQGADFLHFPAPTGLPGNWSDGAGPDASEME
jgi:hypothetical protein